MKILLFAIGCTTLLLTSCEKDEMGIGSTTGGGMQDDNALKSAIHTPENNETVFVPAVIFKTDE